MARPSITIARHSFWNSFHCQFRCQMLFGSHCSLSTVDHLYSNGCLNIFAIICDNYGDVWKVHQTNVATSPRIGGGGANLEITLYDFQQITSHIAKHTPLQGVPSGTHTPLTRCDKVHAPLQGVPDGAPTPLTRCDKVHLGQVCCEDMLHLEPQSSRSRPRGWK